MLLSGFGNLRLVHVHLLHHHNAAVGIATQFLYRHILADFLSCDDLLVQDSGGAFREGVVALLPYPLVRPDVVPHQLRWLVLLDNTDVHVRAGAQIVEDTGQNGVGADLDCLVSCQFLFPVGLEDGHGGEGAGAHGHVGELVGGAMGVDGEEADAGGIDAGDDQVGTNVTLVAEQMLFKQGHDGDDSGLSAG